MNNEYTCEQLLRVLQSYARMIDRDNGQYPKVVLSDIRVSIEYVLKQNNKTTIL